MMLTLLVVIQSCKAILNDIKLQGYNFFNTNSGESAGGVAVYLSMKFNFTPLKTFQLNVTESLWLKLKTNKLYKNNSNWLHLATFN